MSEEFKLGTLKALKMSRKTSSESESLLVIRGNQFHQIMLWVTGFLGIGYGILDYAQGNFDQVIMNISITPIMAVCYWLFKKGFINLSKIFNLVAVTIIISLHSLIQTQATLVLSFFIPIFLSSLILFQGKDRFIGYVLTAIIFAWMVLLLITDVTIGNPISLTRQELKIEWLINLTGSSIVIIMEVIFILILNSSMQNELIEKSKNLDLNNQKLQASLLTKDKLISIISHDIRGPVVMVNSGLQMIELENKLNEEDNLIFEELKKRSNATVNLINNLLIWTRSQTNQIKYKPQNINQSELHEMFSRFIDFDNNKNIKINLSIPDKLDFHADVTMLETILRNLFSNAIKFTPEFGTIDLGAIKSINGTEFYVTDSGVGISDAVKSLIQNGNSYTSNGTNKESGNGLGLQIVREFIQQHNAELTIHSEENKGSRFSFVLVNH
jgi:signal transduction histidine kinase